MLYISQYGGLRSLWYQLLYTQLVAITAGRVSSASSHAHTHQRTASAAQHLVCVCARLISLVDSIVSRRGIEKVMCRLCN